MSSSGTTGRPPGVDAVIFDWGGTLTRWHDVDFHAESLALAAGRGERRRHDLERLPAPRLHAAGDAIWGRSPRPPAERHGRRPVHEAGLDHDPELLDGLLRLLGAAHLHRPRGAARCSRRCGPTGIKVGVLSNTIWPRAWHEGFFERDGVLRPDRRRRLHQRDPVDQAVARRRSRRRWRRSARPTRRAASTSATGSSTTSGAPSNAGLRAIHIPHSDDPGRPGRAHRGRARRRGARAGGDPATSSRPGDLTLLALHGFMQVQIRRGMQDRRAVRSPGVA